MSVALVAQYVNFGLAIVLVARLSALDLIRKYRVFAALIAFDLVTSAVALFVPWDRVQWDYRSVWLATKPISWVLYVWVVFSVLQPVMAGHRGILSMSRRVFAWSFIASIAFGLLSARVEYVLTKPNAPVELALVIDQAVCTVSLLLLLATLVYLLWFPVTVTRNASLLCSGLMVYFALKAVMLLARGIWSPESLRILSLALVLLFSACLALWVLFFTKRGEFDTVRPGHSWKPAEQEKLIEKLTRINDLLLDAAKR